jgi:hypothetical protein
MLTVTIECRDEAERLAIEQAIAYVTQLRSLAQDAPVGSILSLCEACADTQGRQLLRDTLATTLAGRIAADELKGGTPAVASARTAAAPRVPTSASS